MRIEPLLAFCAVVEQGSFSKAAETLYLTQPAISMSIKQLEQEYGQPLLIRRNKVKLTLTPLGEKLYMLTKDMKNVIENVEHLRMDSIQQINKAINIQCVVPAGAYVLTQKIIEFTEIHSDIKLSITTTNTEKAIEDLLQGESDLAMLFSPKDNENLQPVKSWDDEFALVVPSQHPFVQNQPSHQELAAYPFVLPSRKGCATRPVIDELFQASLGRAPNCILELGNIRTVKEAAISMNKPSILLRSMIREELRNGILVPIETKFNFHCQHVLLRLKKRYVPGALRAFIEFC